MTWPCTACGTTEAGHRIGHACLCVKCDAIKSAKSAEHFNRMAEARALAEASHPSGKGPRYRAMNQWKQCRCHIPFADSCPVHGGYA